MSIRENLRIIRSRISRAAQSVGRDPNEIKLVGAVKTLSAAVVLEALAAGLMDIGDNRVQEAAEKKADIRAQFPQVTWHMIGHLQTNKVRQALDIFDIIQSLDSEKLAIEINSRALKPVPVLIEINTSAEENKFGVPIDQGLEFVGRLAAFEKIRIQGLMTVGLLSEEKEKVKTCFMKLRSLREQIAKLDLPNVSMEYLSMGMTDDFEIAIQEGSNLVRIGGALFGERGA